MTTSATRMSSKCWSAACAVNWKARPGSSRSTPCAAWAICSMSAAVDSLVTCALDAGGRHPGRAVYAGFVAGHAGRVQPGIAGLDRAAPGVGRYDLDFGGAGRKQPPADAGAVAGRTLQPHREPAARLYLRPRRPPGVALAGDPGRKDQLQAAL